MMFLRRVQLLDHILPVFDVASGDDSSVMIYFKYSKYEGTDIFKMQDLGPSLEESKCLKKTS